jgi:glycosyltransferase involved in cell wall biosynthesis
MRVAMLRVLTLATLFPNDARPALGGFVERQTQALAALPGVEVEVVAPVGLPVWPLSLHPRYSWLRPLPARETRNGLVVHRPRYRIWPAVLKAQRVRTMVAALLPVLRDIRGRFPFDVIDAEFFWPDGPAANRLADAFGVPFSVKARGSDIHFWGRRPDVLAQIVAAGEAAGGLLSVSAALRHDMIELGLPGEKIRVHHTGVDLDRFRPGAGAGPAPGAAGPVLITVANLIPRKGHELALAALALLPGATLILVGEGSDRGRLEGLARTRGLESRVRFLGAQPHDALPGLLAAADVMVLPTVSEGLANVWVESLACGTPVVTSDVGGAREVIDRPAAGRLVARDPEAIAAAVRELLAAPPDRAAVRAAAEKFSWARNAAELRDHLASLVK